MAMWPWVATSPPGHRSRGKKQGQESGVMAAEACTDDATCPRGRQAEAAATCPGRRSAEARWGRGMLAGGRDEIWTPERNESLEGAEGDQQPPGLRHLCHQGQGGGWNPRLQGGQASTPHLCPGPSQSRESQARRSGPSPHPQAGCVNHWAALSQPGPAGSRADSWGRARVPGWGRVEAGSPS